jgi:mono/diheme cytochrome c family protein
MKMPRSAPLRGEAPRERVLRGHGRRPFLLGATWILALCLLAAPSAAEETAAPVLRFARDGQTVRRLGLDKLRAQCAPRVVQVDDPYYAAPKRFHACPLGEVLALGLGEPPGALGDRNVFLRARDGYVRPAAASQLAEPGAYLAFGDAALEPDPAAPPRWEPIDRRQLDPGPFYLVWTGEGKSDPHRYPWPYQLVSIELAPFESEYPHTVPRTAPPGSPARAGFALFRSECIMCHAINGEGGKVGPDLNVPMSIVEYRPEEKIRAYVRDPERFRYTSMPAHPHFDEGDLDALIAYFETMKTLKHDPRAESRDEP